MILVSAPRPLGTNLSFELGWTGFGLGLGVWGPGLDKIKTRMF